MDILFDVNPFFCSTLPALPTTYICGIASSPMHVGAVAFHCARAPGTAWHRMALDPFNRYPGLHSKRTMEPAENSAPIRLPYLGSGTELHWLSLVRGTALIINYTKKLGWNK